MTRSDAPVASMKARQAAEPRAPRRTRGEAALACAAILLALATAALLALRRLGERPLWVDEVASLVFSDLSWGELFGPLGRLESNPPGYYALLKLVREVLPTSEATLRLPSVLAALGAIAAMAAFCRRAFGWRAAAFAAAFLAVAAGLTRYAQEARAYALLLCATALALLAAQRLLPGPEDAAGRLRPAAAGALGLALGAMAWLHATAVFAIVAVNLYLLVALAVAPRSGRWRGPPLLGLVLADAIGLLIAAGWAHALLGIALAAAEGRPTPVGWLRAPSLGEALAIYRGILFAPNLSTVAPAVGLLYATALGAAVLAAIRRRQAEAAGLAAALLAVLIGMWAASQVAPVLLPRTALFALCLVVPLLAFLASLPRRAAGAAALAAMLLVPQLRGAQNYAAQGPEERERWDLAARHLSREVAPGETVVAILAFEAAALQRGFVVAAPAGGAAASPPPLRVFVPERDTLGEAVADRVLAAPRVSPADVCAPAGGLAGRGVWLAGRPEQATAEPYDAMASALARAGSERVGRVDFDGVRLERWTPPRCGDAPPVTSGRPRDAPSAR